MKAGRKFWCTWGNDSHSIFIVQVFYSIDFEKIFKDPKMERYKNDKFWLGSIQLENKDVLTDGFYTLDHINDLKGGMLSAAGTILIQICHEEKNIFIPNDENMIVGEIQILAGKYINIPPNKFIMTGTYNKENIYLINVDDKVMKLIKRGIECFSQHEHIYDINFLSYRKLLISMKKLQFYNQKFNIKFYVHDQMTVNILKQIIFNRAHKLYNMNIGLEFETAEGYRFE
jgi:hypothetical protein